MRRMTICLAAYGLLLIALFCIMSANVLFFAVSVFLAGSIAVGLVEYRSDILSLKASLDSQIEKVGEKKRNWPMR